MVTRAVWDSSYGQKLPAAAIVVEGSVAPSRHDLNIYVAGLTLAAVAMVTLLSVFQPFASSTNVFKVGTFLALIWFAGLYPIHVAPKTKVSVTTAAIFAAILVFNPLVAVLIAGVGVTANQLFLQNKTWSNVVFSISQTVLFVGTSALVYSALQTTSGPLTLVSAYGFLCAAAAALALYLVNSAAVSVAAGLQTHGNPFVIWLKGTKQSAVQETALLAVGLAAAMIVKQAPWGILLMLAPVVVIYYSFNRMAALNLKVETQLQELKITQAQLVESARMASIGTMVAGIAHQINNPIFVIRGRAETLTEDAEEHLKTPSAKKAVQVIFEMADRVSRIVNSLMPTSQVSEDGMGCCDVNDVVRNTLLLLEPKFLKSSIEITTTMAKNPPLCLGDPCQIQEMLINLLDNACNAMPDGGKLAVATQETESGLSIRVSDTGTGISGENLARIFSPFFTTRKGSGGVGLGLYVSKHIAEKYGGSITVDSRIDKGTVFTVNLPSGSKKMVKLQPEPEHGLTPAAGGTKHHKPSKP